MRDAMHDAKHDSWPAMIALYLCLSMPAAMTLGACEHAGYGDGAGAAVRFQAQPSEETALPEPEPEPEPDLYYNGPPRARARVPLIDPSVDAVAVLRTAGWLHEMSIDEGVRTFGTDRRPYEAVAFEEILRRGDAEVVFEDLLRHASQAGQFYALGGLFLVNRARFQEAVRSYRPRQPWVWYSYGCGDMHWEAHWLLLQLQAGNLPFVILPEGYEADPIFLD